MGLLEVSLCLEEVLESVDGHGLDVVTLVGEAFDLGDLFHRRQAHAFAVEHTASLF